MSQHDDFDRSLARWFDAEARPTATADVLDRALRATRRRRPHPRLFASLGGHWVGDGIGPTSGATTLGRSGVRTSMALLVLLLLVTLVAGAMLVGARLIQPAPDSGRLGIFEPISGWVVYARAGIWGDNPDGADVELRVGAGTPLAWSRDGTRLLIRRGVPGGEYLVVVHADGSETQVTEQLESIGGATFSADGASVVFAAESSDEDWAVYSVDAHGGAATELTSQRDPRTAFMKYSTVSPDGTQIAFVLWGHGDGEHPVWVMDVDGTDAHQIVANDIVMGGGHLRDRGVVAWSPAGDRIALALGDTIYTFATDGSDFTRSMSGTSPVWSPDGSQLVNRRSATWHPGRLEPPP